MEHFGTLHHLEYCFFCPNPTISTLSPTSNLPRRTLLTSYNRCLTFDTRHIPNIHEGRGEATRRISRPKTLHSRRKANWRRLIAMPLRKSPFSLCPAESFPLHDTQWIGRGPLSISGVGGIWSGKKRGHSGWGYGVTHSRF